VARGKKPTQSFHINGDELPRLLVEEVRDYAIVVIDTRGRVQMFNPGAEQMLGFSQRELLGKSASIIFTPEDRAAGVDKKEMATARKKGRAEDERWHVRKNKDRFWGSGVMTLLHDDKGKLIGFVKLLRDHTERKRLEDQTRQMNELLERRVGERTEELLRQQTRLRELALETTNAEQRARDAIAADLHDNLAQIMAVCLMKLAVAQKGFPETKTPERIRRSRRMRPRSTPPASRDDVRPQSHDLRRRATPSRHRMGQGAHGLARPGGTVRDDTHGLH
jgi:PAS domain S-box-containing protein